LWTENSLTIDEVSLKKSHYNLMDIKGAEKCGIG
jgi:hypothetical protein